MYNTLKTKEPSEVTVFFRFPGNKQILRRVVRFEKKNAGLSMYSYPEDYRGQTQLPKVNIFKIDENCNISDITVSSFKIHEALLNKSILSLFSNKKDVSCAEAFIKNTIKTGKQHTWYGQFLYPGTGTRPSYFKSTRTNGSTTIFTTRHIP